MQSWKASITFKTEDRSYFVPMHLYTKSRVPCAFPDRVFFPREHALHALAESPILLQDPRERSLFPTDLTTTTARHYYMGLLLGGLIRGLGVGIAFNDNKAVDSIYIERRLIKEITYRPPEAYRPDFLRVESHELNVSEDGTGFAGVCHSCDLVHCFTTTDACTTGLDAQSEAVSYYHEQGWRKVDDRVLCPDCCPLGEDT